MNETLSTIDELLRIPAPCPSPLSLACDGTTLWVGSSETRRLYGLNAQQGTVFEEATVPGRPFGACVTGDALRVVVADEDDNRSVRRYIFGKDFKSEKMPCPGDTGSFLAYDGELLWISQRFDKRIVQVDEAGTVLRTVFFPREITGMVMVDGRFYFATTESKDVDDYRLMRLDPASDQAKIEELASIPFTARSLAWDGTRFWTANREENTLVAFARP